MKEIFSEITCAWKEPKDFIDLKNEIDRRYLSILERIGGIKIIILFLMLFLLFISVWIGTGKLFSLKLTLVMALLLSSCMSFLIIFILGSIPNHSIGFYRKAIYFNGGSGIDYKNVKRCIILYGVYNNKKYIAIQIFTSRRYFGTAFLSDHSKIDVIKKMLNNKNVKFETIENAKPI